MFESVRTFLEEPALSGLAAVATLGSGFLFAVRQICRKLHRLRAERQMVAREDEVFLGSHSKGVLPPIPYLIVGFFVLGIIGYEGLALWELARKGFDLGKIDTRLMLIVITGAPWSLLFVAQVLVWIDWGDLDDASKHRLDTALVTFSSISFMLFLGSLALFKINDWYDWP